jgi:hypothetical protein
MHLLLYLGKYQEVEMHGLGFTVSKTFMLVYHIIQSLTLSQEKPS